MDNNTPQTQNNYEVTDRSKLIRKVLIGILIFVVLFGIIYLTYNYFKNKDNNTSTSTFPIAEDVIGVIKNIGKGSDSKPEETVLSDKASLLELYKGPVAGYTILDSSRTARVFDSSKGLIFDINLNTGDTKAVTDQPILRVHDVLFVGQNTIITRSLDASNVIKSSIYKFSRDDTTEMLKLENKPTLLSNDITELSKSQNNNFVVFVVKDARGGNIDLYDSNTEKLTRLISLPISEWIPSVSNSGTVYISSKASKYAESGTYKIEKGSLGTVVKAKTAQTTILSPDGSIGLSLFIINNVFISSLSPADKAIDNSLVKESVNPLLSTIADKCAWNKIGTKLFCGIPNKFGPNTPDEWYLGTVSYVDSIWEYDVTTSKSTSLVDNSINNVSIDTVSLEPNGNILFFKNKKDDHLWGFRLNEDADISSVVENNTETNTEENQ